ncbi:MAG: S-layer homology domain-containing protein [Oscillospiraceae bacterium]|nr:S-layer homology domain-containing protein [Oscillospiraceae bacterium]
MKKRIVSLLLIVCMLLTMLPLAALAAKNGFHDVRQRDWYHDAVQYVCANELFNGVSDTEFDPSGTMTRGMFVTVLGRMAGIDPMRYAGSQDFSDVAVDAYYAPYVAWACRFGITNGTGNGMFSPDAPIDRQQLACFFVRYFELFGAEAEPQSAPETQEPADLHLVADWAKDAVMQMWEDGFLIGDGTSFDPTALATRAQTAELCTRLDRAVEVWYCEPGVPSDRVRVEPEDEDYEEDDNDDRDDRDDDRSEGGGTIRRTVSFYDGDRLIDEITTKGGQPLKEMPSVEKASKEGAVLLGYFYDKEFTKPFYADANVYENMDVYAQYSEMEVPETLTVRTFTMQDVSNDLVVTIERSSAPVAGEPELARAAASVQSTDGSDPVVLDARDNGDGTYDIYAPDGYRDGCAYELTLIDGWVFSGKEPTIRTASFTIFMEEVEDLRMGDDIIYVEDTAAMDYTVGGEDYPILDSEVLSLLGEDGEGSFSYTGAVEAGDLLCIYTGKHPEEREKNGDLLDPAMYVMVTDVSGSTVSFAALDNEAQLGLYETPDNFPIAVDVLPEGESGTIDLSELDIPMYEAMVGKEVGNLEEARAKLSVGDFVTMYVSNLETELTGSEDELVFGLVESFDGDTVTYTRVTRQELIDSMDLYAKIDLRAEDFVDEATQAQLEDHIRRQVADSGFAERAAEALLDAAVASEEFENDVYAQSMMPRNSAMFAMSRAGGFTMNDVDFDVRIGGGDRYGGVSIIIGVDANFTLEAEDGYVTIGVSADFEEEVMVAPGAKGELVYKDILGIPVPIGVYVSASVDIMNYTGFSFAAQVTTHSEEGDALNVTDISSELNDLMGTADYYGISEEYFDKLDTLMQGYSELLRCETDWIQLVEEEIFFKEVCYYGLAIGIETDFVVRADMSIAIGSSLSYEVGKRYSVWFKIGLFEPTAGSDTMDLIDEQFAFRFYVMGKLGVKAGIKAKIFVGLGSGKVASVGLTAEVGPYVKLWGLFLYDYARMRPAGSGAWQTSSHIMGALNVEFGMYLILGFEAEALDLFEYSYDFLDEEFPLLEAGDPKYYYRMNYRPAEGDKIYLWDEDRDRSNGIAMEIPQNLRVLDYVNLKTGLIGTELPSYDDLAISLSNPNFSFDEQTGKISVFVPEHVHYLTCDLTVTYLRSKLAFSNYDITNTIPVVWTDLSYGELKDYYTATVRVGNDEDGYERVWTKRVLRGEAFDLPDEAELRKLMGWSNLKYVSAEGYTEDTTSGLTIDKDSIYNFVITPRTYEITVEGIQEADGSEAAPRVYTAKYGEVFDFSDLAETGTDDEENGIYTAFTNVTTEETIATGLDVRTGEMKQQPMDLTKPISGQMAKALLSGDVTATANYIDDSTTAVFTFNGLTHEDVTVTLRKGTVPSMDAVEEILDEEVRKNDGQPLGISEVYPKLSAIDRSTNFIVTCTGLSGARAEITFDVCGGYAMDPVDKLAGSLIVNIPEARRRGYTFRGWFTEPGGAGQDAFTQTVPEEGITIYALWTPNTYCATFHMNGGDGNVPDAVLVTYDDLYENGNVYVAADTEEGFVKGDAYGKLPVPTYTGYKFLGWSTEPDRKADGALRVEDTTIADIYDSDHVLYAQWSKLEILPKNVFVFGNRQYTVYNGSGQTATHSINTDMQYNDEDYYGSHIKNFTEELLSDAVIEYKRDGILSEWEPAAVNAGLYDVKITRASDGNFAAFTDVYYGVLKVEKAESTMRDVPTAACIDEMYYGNLVMDPDYITDYTGDGVVQFAVTYSEALRPSESAWSSGIVSNRYTKDSFYLWTRLSEGNNYKASNAVCSSSAISRTGSAPKALIADDYDGQGFWYLLRVKTSDTSKAGTDSDVYATIGGKTFYLDSDANDHETGDDRKYLVAVGDSITSTDSVEVKISLDKGGLAAGWKLGSLQLLVYKKTGSGLAKDISKDPVLKSSVCTAEDWFLTDDYPRSSKTYTITGLGRSLIYSVSGPQGTVDVTGSGTVEMAVDMTATDSNRGGLTYNAWQRKNAPVFTASFTADKSFDRYLDWSIEDGRVVCSFSKSALCDAMREAGIYQLTLNYGISGKTTRTMYVTIP